MKYSDFIQVGDIRYSHMKSLIPQVSQHSFMDILQDEISQLSSQSDNQKIHRNFMACLKLCKKYEKKTRLLIPRSKIYQLYEIGIFAQHQKSLRDYFDRRYPHFAKTCQMKIIAHRAFVPYHKALEQKFVLRYHPDFVEIDVCLCRSGEVILQHDRFAPSGSCLENSDISELSEIVRLDQLLSHMSHQTQRQAVMIDIKGSSRDTSIVQKIVSTVDSLKIPLHEILLASFNMHYLMYLRQHFPEFPRAFITANAALDDFIPFMQTIDTDLIIIDENSASNELIHRYKCADIKTWVYTVNHTGRFSSIAKMGAAGIITDYPNLLL